MNKRIKKLAEMHGFVNEHMTPGEKSDALKKYEKFAQLIVRECAQVAEDVDGDSRARKCVLEHFGVGE